MEGILSIDQVKKLLNLGVIIEDNSLNYNIFEDGSYKINVNGIMSFGCEKILPTLTEGELLKRLPEVIEDNTRYRRIIECGNIRYQWGLDGKTNQVIYNTPINLLVNEFIDKLYDAYVWCIQRGFIDLDEDSINLGYCNFCIPHTEYSLTNNGNFNFFIDEENHLIAIDDEDGVLDFIEIEYCPRCGRKLNCDE